MTTKKLDYKKEYKDLYMPKTKPSIVDVPEMNFIMIDGQGDPNEKGGEYQKAMEILYGLSWTIKMSKMGENKIPGYFEYVVPPLEGFWFMSDGSKGVDYNHKENFSWISFIRQPEFVTSEVFDWALKELASKKGVDGRKARLEKLTEGLCVQILHKGPYDDEPATVAKMNEFIKESEYTLDINDTRHHHEIYLGDPRKQKPENLKTVLRYPIKKK